MNILIHRSIPDEEAGNFQQRFPHHEVRFLDPKESLDPYWDWVEVFMGNPDASEVAEKASRVKWIQLISSGMDGYDGLKDKGILITTARGTHAPAIAQHILMMMLLLERKQWYFQRRQASREWDRKARFPGLLRGLTIGLIGYGTIAHRLVDLLTPFDLNILAIAKHQTDSIPSNVTLFETKGTEAVLGSADHVILALPLTSETRHFMSRKRFQMMKPGACFHNVGRGELVEEEALIECLQNGHLGGAAVDVFKNEPLDPSSPLWAFPHCIVTPHIAGHHKDLDLDLLEFFGGNLRKYDEGATPFNIANFKRGY